MSNLTEASVWAVRLNKALTYHNRNECDSDYDLLIGELESEYAMNQNEANSPYYTCDDGSVLVYDGEHTIWGIE